MPAADNTTRSPVERLRIHAPIVTVVWICGLLGLFLKQPLAMSDYATYQFDFHKLFTLQKLWRWLLSCAKAFTYVVRNAAQVKAIILEKTKNIRLHKACHFAFLHLLLALLFAEKILADKTKAAFI